MIQQGGEIESIYYRSNGIVAVNFKEEGENAVNYSNLQIRITEQGVEISTTMPGLGYAAGTVKDALIDELAIYPETFPY